MIGRIGWKVALAALAALAATSGVLAAIGPPHLWVPWHAKQAGVSRTDEAALSPAWSNVDSVVRSNQERLRAHPEDQRAYVVLGEAYLQKARDTGDPAFYTKADAVLRKAVELKGDDFEALAAQGALALARHQFRDAERLGARASQINPYNATALGVAGDAQIELGEYPAAIQTFQRMVDLRPDLSSYARVSYARELHGDMTGAIEAMRQAAVAGGPAPENVAWTSWQLGTLYFDVGDLDSAQRELERGLAILPRYVHAEAGLGMVEAARGHHDAAIARYTAAVNAMPWPAYVIALGDLYQVSGKPEDAAREYGLVEAMEQLFKENGVDVDMDLALFDADHRRNLDEAVALARQAYRDRPSVTAADALAWTLYQHGDCREAAAVERDAMRLGTKLPLMLFHAGMVAGCAGDAAAARGYLEQTERINPHFSVLYESAARDTLASIRASQPLASAAVGGD